MQSTGRNRVKAVRGIELSGSFQTASSADRVLSFIRSPESVGRILPDVRSFDVVEGQVSVRFRLDLESMGGVAAGYLSTATASMKFHYEGDEPDRVRIAGSGRALGSAVKVEVEIAVAGSPEGSCIEWWASVDTGALLGLLGRETIDNASANIIAGIIEALKDELDG